MYCMTYSRVIPFSIINNKSKNSNSVFLNMLAGVIEVLIETDKLKTSCKREERLLGILSIESQTYFSCN